MNHLDFFFSSSFLDTPKEASISTQIQTTKQEPLLASSETRCTNLGEQTRLSYSLGDVSVVTT